TILWRITAAELADQHSSQKSIKQHKWQVDRDIDCETTVTEDLGYLFRRDIMRFANLPDERAQARVQGLASRLSRFKLPRSRAMVGIHVLDCKFFGEFHVGAEVTSAITG